MHRFNVPNDDLARSPIHTVQVGDRRKSDATATIKLNGKEFGGPIGTFILMLILPVVVIYLILLSAHPYPSLLRFVSISIDWNQLFNPKCLALVSLWLMLHGLLYFLPLGKIVKGRELYDGTRLQYKCNGFHVFILCMGGLLAVYLSGLNLSHLIRNLPQLAFASIIVAFGLSVILFLKSFTTHPAQRSEHGNTGCTVYDFFMGRELNPRVFSLDLKFVSELRPGLIGWLLIDWCALFISLKDTQEVINWPLIFIVATQTIYVADAIYNEESILSTLDILHEGFGFMLVFGDLVWVPFVYSLQAQFLIGQRINRLPCASCLIPLVILFAVGYYIFRASNSEKDRFRADPRNPENSKKESIVTNVRDRRILCDGWWGWIRHPNYLGDILMATSWSLACGLHYVLPYIYPLYLIILLVFRARRDHRMNLGKYGSAWTTYCQKVPYIIFPKLY